ncbi:alpha/beta fold hydrolase [Sphingomonas sp. GCM10030256]|uniref:alpha/beta fold hydrolase n=1 Tax=Sphingomonas sp. GCM10030256 TaxID=3273427 RepID=UPI00360A0606
MPTTINKSARSGSSSRSSGKDSSLWKWGLGAGVGAAALGVVAFNAAKTRRAEASNPPIGEFIEVDGVRLHYLEKGTGPVIVLLHGNGTMIQDWIASGVFGRLAETHRVIAFDRPGFGHSERPRSVVWTPAAQARVLASAIAKLGARDATIVGHSFGTMVAVALGLDHPEVASSLVLISGYYYPSARVDALVAAPPAIPIIGDVLRFTVSPLVAAASQDLMEKQMFGPAPVSEGWREDFPFKMTLRPSQIRAAAADAAIMVPAAASMAPRLAELQMPVTIISGSGDHVVTPSKQSGRLNEDLAKGRLTMIEGAGHMVHHTAADEVAAKIRNSASNAG